MTTKTQLLSAFFLFSSLSLFSQHQFGVQVGLGSYSTPDTYMHDEISENGMIHGRGSANLPDFIAAPALQLAYQYQLTSRFRLAA